MTDHVILDNRSHRDLRIITDRSAPYDAGQICTSVFPIEYRQAQCEYPIVFTKNRETGGFEPVVLLGLAEGENLYQNGDGWQADYLPLSIERQPFLIGFQSNSANGADAENPVVYIDLDSPRVSRTRGEPVFAQDGGNSALLDHVSSVLLTIHQGHEQNREFAAKLAHLGLFEPFSIEVTLDDQSQLALSGFYTIDEVRLRDLSGETMADLHRAGYVEDIYMILASLPNFKTLINRKNALL